MNLRKIDETTSLPVSLVEAREYMRVSDPGDEWIIEQMIRAATDQAETHCSRSIVRKQWELVLDCFPSTGALVLPMPPISTASSDVSIEYVADDDAMTVTALASTSYYVDHYSEPGAVYPVSGSTWPDTASRRDAVRVRYWAGYSSPAEVPAPIRQWIMLVAATMYEHREIVSYGSISARVARVLPRSLVDGLLDGYVVPPWGD
mgnify:FL=1